MSAMDDNPFGVDDGTPYVPPPEDPANPRCAGCRHVKDWHRDGLDCEYESHDYDGSTFCYCDYFRGPLPITITNPTT